MKRDTGKIHFCSHCPKTFGEGCHLKEHLESVHTGEKPQSCKLCPKFFSLIGNLNPHMRFHNSGISYMGSSCHCNDCHKSFKFVI